jgi:hypothetical protein
VCSWRDRSAAGEPVQRATPRSARPPPLSSGDPGIPGRFERSLYLLIVYVAVIALARGITDIIMAFRLHKLSHGG